MNLAGRPTSMLRRALMSVGLFVCMSVDHPLPAEDRTSGGVESTEAKPADVKPPTLPRTPADEQRSFVFADENLTADLILAEPEIVSPVAVAWDASGALYVVQMSDYPLGPDQGSVWHFTDIDGDGHYEQRTEFATGLPFPNGVMPWKDGILVTAAPDIWHFGDANHDGRADLGRRILTGFAEGNQQLRANGLYWGIDNWIYGANGRSDGEVSWALSDDPEVRAKSVSIRRRDFRFRPDRQKFEAIAGNSQFGMAHDDWGRRYPVFNNIPLRQVVVEDRYVDAAPHVPWPETVPDIGETPGQHRVYPLTSDQFYIPQSAGYSTSGCGPTIVRASGLGPDYSGHALVCEPVQNLVMHHQLVEGRVQRIAKRVERERDRDFLAASDPWFHPVYLTTGPDGCLWMVDFYRKIVEHPYWVAEDLRGRIDWREGEAHGRLWRIRAKNFAPSKPKRWPAQMSSADLVDVLKDANGWWRDTAHRLLVERGDQSVVPQLKEMLHGASAEVTKVHALRVLQEFAQLDERDLVRAIESQLPELCRHALIVCEETVGSNMNQRERGIRSAVPSPWEIACLKLRSHDSADVRFQLGLTWGRLKFPSSVQHSNLTDMRELSRRGIGDPWQACSAASFPENVSALLRAFEIDALPVWNLAPSTERTEYLRVVFSTAGALGQEAQVLHRLGERSDSTQSLDVLAAKAVLADALRSGAMRQGHDSSVKIAGHESSPRSSEPHLIEPFWTLVEQPTVEAAVRAAALRVIIHLDQPDEEKLTAVLLLDRSTDVQREALRALLASTTEVAQRTYERWPAYSLAVRRLLFRSAAQHEKLVPSLLAEIEADKVLLAEIEPDVLQILRNSPNPEVRTRVEKLLERLGNADRMAVVETYRGSLQLVGDRVRGARIFNKQCVSCHALAGRGGQVGPDLTAIATHARATLLVEILDPSSRVLPDFVSYVCVTIDGRTLAGRIVGETENSIMLRRPNEADLSLSRDQIEELRATGKSMMPDGLEQGLTLQDFADLVEFLQAPSAKLLFGEDR